MSSFFRSQRQQTAPSGPTGRATSPDLDARGRGLASTSTAPSTGSLAPASSSSSRSTSPSPSVRQRPSFSELASSFRRGPSPTPPAAANSARSALGRTADLPNVITSDLGVVSVSVQQATPVEPTHPSSRSISRGHWPSDEYRSTDRVYDGEEDAEDHDQARTPTAEGTGPLLQQSRPHSQRFGQGFLTLDQLSPSLPSSSSSFTSPPTRVGRTGSASSSASLTPSASRLNSTISTASLAPPSAPDATNSSSDLTAARKRRASSSFSTSKRADPSNGIAAALVAVSKDLMHPAGLPPTSTAHISTSSTPQIDSGLPPPSLMRPRANTAASNPSSVASEESFSSPSGRRPPSAAASSYKKLGTPVSAPSTGAARTAIADDMRPRLVYDDPDDMGDEEDTGDDDDDDDEGLYSDEDSVLHLRDDAAPVGGEKGGRSEGRASGGGSSGEDEDDDGYYANDLDDLPVTGFAVASVKRNADFHQLFGGQIPEGDYLIEDYGCALQKDILVQGRLYVSENHICFYANIFGWITSIVIPSSEILRIDKKMTAFVIPNAILISTLHVKYTFASFLSRDTTWDVIHNIWRLSHPHVPGASQSTDHVEDESGPSMLLGTSSSSGPALASNNGDVEKHGDAAGTGTSPPPPRKGTTCACGLKGEHYSETALDVVYPSTPDKIYKLMFDSSFATSFMVDNQRLMELNATEWLPSSEPPSLPSRKYSYIKPLSGGFGPKQTRCELEDCTMHVDWDEYASILTTTRTPEVPSGGVFAVKTRTCLMWSEGGGGTRCWITCQVDWKGRSFIKGIIDSSALAGQRSFHSDLEKAIRKHISQNPDEYFLAPPASISQPSSSAGAAIASQPTSNGTSATQSVLSAAPASSSSTSKEAGAASSSSSAPASSSLPSQLLDSVLDTLSSTSPKNLFVGLLILGLVLSNLWTLGRWRVASAAGETSASVRARTARRPPSYVIKREDARGAAGTAEVGAGEVADAVKVFLEEYISRREDLFPARSTAPASAAGDGQGARDEILDMERALQALETRMMRMKEELDQVKQGRVSESGREDDSVHALGQLGLV